MTKDLVAAALAAAQYPDKHLERAAARAAATGFYVFINVFRFYPHFFHCSVPNTKNSP